MEIRARRCNVNNSALLSQRTDRAMHLDAFTIDFPVTSDVTCDVAGTNYLHNYFPSNATFMAANHVTSTLQTDGQLLVAKPRFA